MAENGQEFHSFSSNVLYNKEHTGTVFNNSGLSVCAARAALHKQEGEKIREQSSNCLTTTSPASQTLVKQPYLPSISQCLLVHIVH